MNDIETYLYDNFDVRLKLTQMAVSELAHLPLYLKGNYSILKGNLFGREMIWAGFKNDYSPSPDELFKQYQQLRRILQLPVVFQLDKLQSWQRKRLIEKQVPFVEPFRQLYIPELMLQLSDTRYKNTDQPVSEDHFSIPAQLALLYHLEIRPIENLPLQEIAGILSYSAMTVTRVAKEFASAQLVKIEGAKEKLLRFQYQGRSLWEKALPYLRSPFKEIWFTDNRLPMNTYKLAGNTALAEYTMLAETKQLSCAIGKEAFNYLKANGTLGKLHPEFGENRLEVWLYNPLLLTKGKAVDKLSLYLSMRNETDERVQRALQDLINEMTW